MSFVHVSFLEMDVDYIVAFLALECLLVRLMTNFEFSDFGHEVVIIYWCLSQMEWEFPPHRSHE